MTGLEREIQALKSEPPVVSRHGWRDWWRPIAAGFFYTVAVAGLVLGVANVAVQRSSDACQDTINQQYRTDATTRAEITTEDRQALDRWITSVGLILTTQPDDALQQLIDATGLYTSTRAQNDRERLLTPLDALTGRC